VMIDLPDPSVMQVEVKINESRMDKLEVDLPATIEVEGVPNERFTGKVTKIGVLADSQNRWLNPNLKEYTNEITLDQAHPDLKPGASAKVEILVTQLEDVLAVPVQSVFTKTGHSYVFVCGADGPEYKEVKLGLASTEYVEIVEGLEPGDKVALVVTDDLERSLPADIAQSEEKGPMPPIPIPGAGKAEGERQPAKTDKPAGSPSGAKPQRPGEQNRQRPPAATRKASG
jgi:HlyD family secretion protein